MDDNLLIEQILLGDHTSYEGIMEKYHNELFSYIYQMTGDYTQTEDLVQEVFIKTYHNLSKYRKDKASFRTWLYRIASNHTLNYFESKTYKQLISESSYQEETISSDEDVLEQVIKEEQINQIIQAMNKVLKPKHKKIMMLHYFSGLTVKEISETTNIPLKTVYKAIESSIEKIKQEVSYHG